MWPYGNPMIPAFFEARRKAANITPTGDRGNYTVEQFQADFPQFFKREDGTECYTSFVPETMLETFVDMANNAVTPSRWGEHWQYYAGLYTAHFATLYLKTYADGSESPAEVASASEQQGLVSSATMGDTSVSYDNKAINAGFEKWGAWNETVYGSQLATMARMLGIGGTYAI